MSKNQKDYNDLFESYGNYAERKREREARAVANAKMRRIRFINKILKSLIAVVLILGIALFCVTLVKPQSLDGTYTQTITSGDNVVSGTIGYANRNDNTATIAEDAKSDYAIVIEVGTNTVLASKNANERIYPASMTKVMTLLVAAENIDDTSKLFKMTSEIIDPLYKQDATITGLKAGEEVPLVDLLYGISLPSGADAAVAIATYVSGSEKDFVKLMNKKVIELGLTGTHFSNTTGMDSNNHYTTVHDMAIITRAAMQNELCRKIMSTKEYTTTSTEKNPGGITFQNGVFSKMKGDEPEKVTVIGGKTGFTNKALYCLTSFAVTDDNRELICVTAKGEGKYDPIYDAIDLYTKYGYPDFEETESNTSSN